MKTHIAHANTAQAGTYIYETSAFAWGVWLVSMMAYVVAIANRTSFGVAGVHASLRFSCPASTLSMFTVMQMLIYVVLQIPVGILLNRFGSRILIASGSALMGTGGLLLAVASNIPLAVAGRFVIGAGDALTFISVLRLLPKWFSKRQVPLLSQLSGLIGQFGQLISAVPFLVILSRQGWSTAFEALSFLSFGIGFIALLVIRDSPRNTTENIRAHNRILTVEPPTKTSGTSLLDTWRTPGTRLGFWIHFTAQFPGTVFALLWGVPYLESVGYSTNFSAGMLILLTLSSVLGGIVYGLFSTSYPRHELWLVVVSIIASVLPWVVMIVFQSSSLRILPIQLALGLGLAAPGSMVAFDYVRRGNPDAQADKATGIANSGGFTASLIAMLLIGVTLDLLNQLNPDSGLYNPEHFAFAMATQIALVLVGSLGILRSFKLYRKQGENTYQTSRTAKAANSSTELLSTISASPANHHVATDAHSLQEGQSREN